MIKFNGLGAMLEWKYGLVASTKQFGDKMVITKWKDDKTDQPDEYQIGLDMADYEEFLASIVYKAKRSEEYPNVGDQLDAIIKTLKHIKAGGVDIGADGDELVAQVDAVKDKYPKTGECEK